MTGRSGQHGRRHGYPTCKTDFYEFFNNAKQASKCGRSANTNTCSRNEGVPYIRVVKSSRSRLLVCEKNTGKYFVVHLGPLHIRCEDKGEEILVHGSTLFLTYKTPGNCFSAVLS